MDVWYIFWNWLNIFLFAVLPQDIKTSAVEIMQSNSSAKASFVAIKESLSAQMHMAKMKIMIRIEKKL